MNISFSGLISEILERVRDLKKHDTPEFRIEIEEMSSILLRPEHSELYEYIQAEYPALSEFIDSTAMIDAHHNQPSEFLYPIEELELWVDTFLKSGEMEQIINDAALSKIIDLNNNRPVEKIVSK